MTAVTRAWNSAGGGLPDQLRHTGIRIEELLELTHLALVTYRLPDTGEVVPLLRIVPSKQDSERIRLVPPEPALVRSFSGCGKSESGRSRFRWAPHAVPELVL
ncbi:hypothetical protein GCM10010517_34300 [Streptosporangium fragile]|uniref:Uncharacterized protein n=1 Tax=Streptosporangium fragile TaxID=46186 RepID=A0ABP6IGW1_9ACTN